MGFSLHILASISHLYLSIDIYALRVHKTVQTTMYIHVIRYVIKLIAVEIVVDTEET